MASVEKSFTYDIFLSFAGKDTRRNFVDHLYLALKQKGITTYKDDIKIEKGEMIDDQLKRSIEDSRFYMIVFSKNYASSSWCLEELVKIMECQKMAGHTAYPIFYDVEPTELRHQSGAVKDAFAEHVEKEAAGRWKEALKEAADLAGWELKNTVNGHEAQFIQSIVIDISRKLQIIKRSVDEKLVGMVTRVRNVVSSLEIDSVDVRMIGIKGMGGCGKTTLARAVFDHMFIKFDGVSFVENVSEVSKSPSGLKELQKQVLSDVLMDQSIVVTGVSDGKEKMKWMMGSKKVLIVLDDVDNKMQLEALAGELSWFGPGSRIIITTRDEQVLLAHAVHNHNIHDVNLLLEAEAISLFSRHAFERDTPIQGYEELSRKVVHYAAGVPLTIKVLGSHFCHKTMLEWEDAIKKLERTPLKGTLEKLELSYVGLDDEQQQIFLDVACILKGEQKEQAIRILESCGFHLHDGLKVLERKSLVSISDTDCLRLHDLIQEMGKDIVRRVQRDEIARHNRLWITDEIEEILENDLGTGATRCIKLEYSDLHPATIMEGLRMMNGLRFLYVDGGYQERKIDEAGKYLPNTLRSLHWPGYPYRCFPKTYKATMLVNLEMPRSNISQLWKAGEDIIKGLKKLRFLDFKFSKLRTFNLGLTPNLERLDLRGCNELVELQMPIECPMLNFLNLSGSKVSNLNLGRAPNLNRLDLDQCYRLQQIQAPVGCLEKLVFLKLSGCSRFDDFQVNKRYELPGGDSLAKLQLIAKSVDICPFHPTSNLPKFQFNCFYDEPISSSYGNLEKLISFGLCVCTDIESFSETICGLHHLRVLKLDGDIPRAPKDFHQLESLEELSLSIHEITNIPDSICILKHLKSLKLQSCWDLEQPPADLGRLRCLQELLVIDCISLRDIPKSICNMEYLEYLHLPYCSLVEKLPEQLGRLRRLKELNIEGAGITNLPKGISQMKGLCIIWSRVLLESHGFTSLRNVSEYTASCNV